MTKYYQKIILIVLLTAVGVYADEAAVKDSITFDNEYVTVLRNSSLRTYDGYTARVIVALSDMVIVRHKKERSLHRGTVEVIPSQEMFKQPAGDYFEINIKKDHPPLTEPEQWIEPQMNTMIYQDEQFRIFEERLPPGGERALHSHAQRLVVRLNDVRLTDPRTHPDGTPGGGRQVPNTVKFAEPVVHVVKNLSDIPLFNIVIEFKLPSKIK